MSRPGSTAARRVVLAIVAVVATMTGVACDPGQRAGGDGAAGTVGPPDAHPAAAARLRARIRRLSNAELAVTLTALLGETPPLPADLVPDARQDQFTANGAQRVDPLFAAQIEELAQALASRLGPALAAQLGCQGEREPCAARFIDQFVGRAWRRPVTPAEREDLLAVFRAGGSSFADGIALVVEATLQSASFLYLTELGSGPATNGEVRLGPYEIASSLSYFASGGPPDAPLMAAATAGALGKAAERAAQVRRLMAGEGGQRQVQRFVAEWLGLDRLAGTRKDTAVYPEFQAVRAYMAEETDAFVAEVVFRDQGTLARLLTADYSVAAAPLAAYYHLEPVAPQARVTLGPGPRRGLLTQGSFLAVHAHADGSAPIKRGVAVLDRLLCTPLPPPPDPALTMTLPRAEPALTTRARFEAHTREPSCAVCHDLIDPLGFAFEGFDGAGQWRTEENGQPVSTAAEVRAGAFAGPVAGAADLAGKLAASGAVAACLARHFFRFAAAQGDDGAEGEYLRSVWGALPEDRRGNFRELFASWAASDMFVVRAVGP
jgi:hypothetical protein